MGFFSNLFSSKNNQVSTVDATLIQQLANIESSLENQDDFYGVFGEEDRNALESLCEKNASSFSFLNLALIHLYGINVPNDHSKSEQLLLKSVSFGNPFAYKYLALIEEETKHNLDQAILYLKKGSDSGDDAAMANLGFHYIVGNGVQLDKDEAIRLWKKAAKLGNKSAMINLDKANA
jgi:TPR repeat protein